MLPAPGRGIGVGHRRGDRRARARPRSARRGRRRQRREAAAGAGRARTRSPSTPPRCRLVAGLGRARLRRRTRSFRVAALRADGARTRAFSSPLVGPQPAAARAPGDVRRRGERPRLPPRDRSGRRRGREVAARGRAHDGLGERGDRAARPLPARTARASRTGRSTRWCATWPARPAAVARGVRDALAAELSGRPEGRAGSPTCSPRPSASARRAGYAEEKIFWAARRLFEALAERRPLVVVLDDLQWAEATFLDLVEHVADLARGAPLLLLCLARPELLDARRGWAGGKLNATLDPAGAARAGGEPRAGGQPRRRARARTPPSASRRPARAIRCSPRSCSPC